MDVLTCEQKDKEVKQDMSSYDKLKSLRLTKSLVGINPSFFFFQKILLTEILWDLRSGKSMI